MKTRHLFAATIAALFIAPAIAQTPIAPVTPKVDKRQENQAARIEQGKASGQLNEKEAARLDAGQARVATAEEKAKADGKVTKKERARLQHKENKQSRRIAKQKHDKQVAPVTTPAN